MSSERRISECTQRAGVRRARRVETVSAAKELGRPVDFLKRVGIVGGLVILAAFFLLMRMAAAAEGWFSQAQATGGHQYFNNLCAQCHGPELAGAAGPALVGQAFLDKWTKKPVSALYQFEHKNMPAVNPGSVPPDQLWAITAYILQRNGFPPGTHDLGAADAKRVLTKP
jgi:S-disulfanyl-L-cysteine oxidoreductase SoxD